MFRRRLQWHFTGLLLVFDQMFYRRAEPIDRKTSRSIGSPRSTQLPFIEPTADRVPSIRDPTFHHCGGARGRQRRLSISDVRLQLPLSERGRLFVRGGTAEIGDFPALQGRRAKRRLLFRADIRRSPESHRKAA